MYARPLFHRTGLSNFVTLDGRRGAVTALLALLIGDIGGVFAAAAVTGAVSAALNELDSGRPVNAVRAYRLAARNARALGGATGVQFVLILLLTAQSLTFIDITGSIVYSLIVPYAAIALTLYYFDLKARAAPGAG